MTKEPRFKISGKVLIIGFIVLAVIVAVTAWINLSQKGSGGSGYSLSVMAPDDNGKLQCIKCYSLQEIKKMKNTDVYAKLVSADKGNEEGTFTGVEVKTILQDADSQLLERYKSFIFTAGDRFSSAASIKEIEKSKNIILAFEKDGKALEHFNDGGSGPMRIIFSDDTYGNRGTKNLVKITCK